MYIKYIKLIYKINVHKYTYVYLRYLRYAYIKKRKKKLCIYSFNFVNKHKDSQCLSISHLIFYLQKVKMFPNFTVLC